MWKGGGGRVSEVRDRRSKRGAKRLSNFAPKVDGRLTERPTHAPCIRYTPLSLSLSLCLHREKLALLTLYYGIYEMLHFTLLVGITLLKH